MHRSALPRLASGCILSIAIVGACASNHPPSNVALSGAEAASIGCWELSFSPDSDSKGQVPEFPHHISLTPTPVTAGPGWHETRPTYQLGAPYGTPASHQGYLFAFWWETRGDTLLVVESDGYNWSHVRLAPSASGYQGTLGVGGDIGPPFERDHWRAVGVRVQC
jgi:hypothetical protein